MQAGAVWPRTRSTLSAPTRSCLHRTRFLTLASSWQVKHTLAKIHRLPQPCTPRAHTRAHTITTTDATTTTAFSRACACTYACHEFPVWRVAHARAVRQRKHRHRDHDMHTAALACGISTGIARRARTVLHGTPGWWQQALLKRSPLKSSKGGGALTMLTPAAVLAQQIHEAPNAEAVVAASTLSQCRSSVRLGVVWRAFKRVPFSNLWV